MKILLVGYAGSGKTTIGRQIADRLQTPFFDLDQKIERHMGLSVADIFQQKGETVFRQYERQVLQMCLAQSGDLVLSTGGGTASYKNNMQLMNAAGVTVFLEVPVDELINRLINQTAGRPMLAEVPSTALPQYVRHTLQERQPYYQEAQLVVPGYDSQMGHIIASLKDILPR